MRPTPLFRESATRTQRVAVAHRPGRISLHRLPAFAPASIDPPKLVILLFIAAIVGFTIGVCPAGQIPSRSAIGPTGINVQPAFGGTILGFDIDPTGNLGLLSEFTSKPDGTILAATEIFDQATGQIVAVAAQTQRHDDFITLGVVGNSIGLVEREHPLSLFNVQRTFSVIDPLAAGMMTGAWNPPLGRKQNINQVKTDAGTSTVAVLALDFSGHGNNTIFTSEVGNNTFGPSFQITDEDFNFENSPVMTFDSKTNQAILGHNDRSPFIVPPMIGFLDLATGAFTKFAGKGLGVVNGIAVDSEDGILCTTVSFVPTVQFYDLATRQGFSVRLPGAGDSLFRGQSVVFDAVNKLFLVAQEFTSTGASGSSIQIFDIAGTFIESIDGLDFINPGRLSAIRIAINPVLRLGFVEGPPAGKTIQSFSY